MVSGLVAREVCVSRGGRTVLDRVSFALRPGEICGLSGPSGRGKSTLLRTLVRLVALDGGVIALDGTDLRELDARELRRRVGFVAQAPAMLPGTVADNLAYGVVAPAVGRALDAAGLDAAFADRPADRLSGGERARVALARALTRDPELLLLDEPTAALDSALVDRLGASLRELRDAGLGICVATHDRGFVARFTDRVVEL